MNICRARHGSGTPRGRLGWVRVMVLAAILAGIFVMHTAGHAEDGSAAAQPVIQAQHSAGHVQATHGVQALHAGHAPPAGHAGHLAHPAAADPAAAGDPHERGFGCDLTSMCLGLLAGAAVLLVLARARVSGLPCGPWGGTGDRPAPRAAPPRPPSLAVLSVSRT